MFNELKTKVSYNYAKRYYCKISEVENIEEVYYLENKLVVVVNDDEIGKQIYNIVKKLKEEEIIISTTLLGKEMNFRVYKYISDKQNKINMFYIHVDFKANWSELSKIERLEELLSIIINLENKGYILDSSKFENEKLNCISTFLSLFSLDDDKNVDASKQCIIKYIHYVLSDGIDFAEYYKKMENDVLVKISDFPYPLPIITMCYYYFKNNTTYSNIEILEILQKAEQKCEILTIYNYKYLITSKEAFKLKFHEIERDNNYTIYDRNIKIYHNASDNLKEFLKYYDMYDNNIKDIINPVEKSDNLIIDFNENIVGYKFSENEKSFVCNILEIKLKNQNEIFNFIISIDNKIKRIRMATDSMELQKCKSEFNIEEDMVCYHSDLLITNMDKLLAFITTNETMIKNQLTSIFFELYLRFLNNKYGKMYKREELLEKCEVRFLSPVLTNSFIKYVQKEQIDYDLTSKELNKFLYNTKIIIDERQCYDSRYEYNPIDTPFIFDYELEQKYGVKIKSGMNTKLADNRLLIIFKEGKKISTLKNREKALRNAIHKNLGDIEDNHVKIVGISKIIYSKSYTKCQNDNYMYDCIGYITEPIKGNKLSDEKLLTLSNKELLQVIAYLFFNKFGKYYIPYNVIWMDDKFKFYINILDEDFQIEKSKYKESSCLTLINDFLENLLDKGYNPNILIDLQNRTDIIEKYIYPILYHNNIGFDAYCKIHDIYYHRHLKCPACSKSIYIIPDNFDENDVIFTDLYATHYKLDNDYNLKLYKASCSNVNKLEKNIDNIISRRLNSEQPFGYYPKEDNDFKNVDFIQECFIPYKKAINSNNEFVGYIYKTVNFDGGENVCSDISDLSKVKNLTRIMSLIRLILQVKELTSKKLSFIQNPFTNVFLNLNCKKQVQIANIEFLGVEGNVEDTIKWTFEYVTDIIKSDDSINIKMPNKSTNLDLLLEKLQALPKKMKKYCIKHNIYYNNEKIFCPKCVDKVKTKNIKIKTEKLESITSKEQENEGGEAIIYSYGNDEVAKVFKEGIVNYNYKSIILYHLACKKQILEELNNESDKYYYVTPNSLLVDNKSHNIFGYTMKKVEGMPIVILRDKEQVARLGITIKDVLEILITVGKGIEALHNRANIFIGDLNNTNILFDTKKTVYFLDFDGMGIDDITPKTFTDGFIDPISKKNNNITKADDWYSFAIQAFYYLTFTHPFNGIFYAIDEKTGLNVILEIPDKMECRISLLGDHGMNPPAIANDWKVWMNKELQTAFLNIFEGDNRESIVPYLIKQYKDLYNREPFSLSKKSISINSKFIAKEITPFKGDVIRIINDYSAICLEISNNSKYYVSILIEKGTEKVQYDIDFPECKKINNILLPERTSDISATIAYAIYSDKVIAMDLQTNTEVYSTEIIGMKNVCINSSTLYFTGKLKNEEIIFQIELLTDKVKQNTIKFLVEQKTRAFLAKFNSKFVLVKASQNIDEIYCNSEKLCDIDISNSDVKYNIIYDNIANMWLVVNTDGNAIIIKSNGYEKINILEGINETNIENISFRKGNIYIPNQDFLYIVNVKDQITIKKMECNTIMTPNSKVYSNTKGFRVITNNILYEVQKG